MAVQKVLIDGAWVDSTGRETFQAVNPQTGQAINEEYPVSPWAEVERAVKAGPDTTWQCGEATVYKTGKLVTKKGDPSTHKLDFAVPPDATCWIGEPPPLP